MDGQRTALFQTSAPDAVQVTLVRPHSSAHDYACGLTYNPARLDSIALPGDGRAGTGCPSHHLELCVDHPTLRPKKHALPSLPTLALCIINRAFFW